MSVALHVPEITPLLVRPSGVGERRLNIVLPSINPEHYFGGIHTAVELYRSLVPSFRRSRIVVLDSAPRPEALERFPDHELADSSTDPQSDRVIVPFNDRAARTLPVSAGDTWIATAWWTAYAAQRAIRWQDQYYGASDPLVYLIQDYEPGFYPWSSQSILAESTYRPDRDIAVFNTSILRDYFGNRGVDYLRSACLEPTLNDALRPGLAVHSKARDRKILVYARPSTPRNGFPLLCEALRAWAAKYPASRNWQVVGAGELTDDVDLGPLRIEALGKLPLPQYLELLTSSAVGLSWMISPHPSYPPLEMAAMGMSVVTNRYENKDLSRVFAHIASVADPSPESIADALVLECRRWERSGMQRNIEIDAAHPFLGGSRIDAVAADVIKLMGA